MNKQDEEKAREIIGCPCGFKIRDCKACTNMLDLLEMADWKQEQMIEKVSLFFIDTFKELPNGYGTFKIKRNGSIEQLIKDFKKAMEEDLIISKEEFEIEGSSNFNHLTFYLKTNKPEKIGDLAVRFNSGAIYLYFNIKRSWIDEILNAESRGKKLRELIITNKDINYTCIKKKD